MTRLSAFLITKNEARDIGACLDSLRGWVQEIVVVDDESTDGTPDICRGYGATVISHRFEGFAKQKQYALDRTTGEWAFSIDADERVTPDLSKEIQAIVQSPASLAAYRIPRTMYFLGSRLRFGGVGHDRVLRLFRRDQGKYKEVRVHESIEVQGAIGQCESALDHFSYASVAEYLAKASHYTDLAAQDLWAKGRRFSMVDHLRPLWELFARVVLKGAWLDGAPGLVYAGLSSYTAWLRSIKLWELGRRGRDAQPS